MPFTKLTKDMNIIQKLDDEPNDVGGMTSAELKAKFDEGCNAMKEWINNVFIPEAEQALKNALLGQIDPSVIPPEKIGAVSKAGDTMTGSLSVKKSSWPEFTLCDATNGSGAALRHNNHSTMLRSMNVSGDESNMRTLRIYDSAESASLVHALRFVDTVDNAAFFHSVYHTGNKPSGSYTGNGDAASRTVDMGGIGHVLLIYNQNGYAIVCPSGVIGKKGTNLYALTASEAKFTNGVLTMATTDTVLNASGITGHYQVL